MMSGDDGCIYTGCIMVEWILSGLLALAFLGVGSMQLSGSSRQVAEFERYGLSSNARMALGAVKLLAAAALMFPEFRWMGASLCAVILLGACGVHMRHAEWPRVGVALVFLAMAGWIAVRACPWGVGAK
jgi:hypothetical protein